MRPGECGLVFLCRQVGAHLVGGSGGGSDSNPELGRLPLYFAGNVISIFDPPEFRTRTLVYACHNLCAPLCPCSQTERNILSFYAPFRTIPNSLSHKCICVGSNPTPSAIDYQRLTEAKRRMCPECVQPPKNSPQTHVYSFEEKSQKSASFERPERPADPADWHTPKLTLSDGCLTVV
jgi:hypothetical protein